MARSGVTILVIVSLMILAGVPGKPFKSRAEEDPATSSAMVVIEHDSFSPEEIRVKAGTEVVWENRDSTAHSVKADDGSFDSGSLARGGKYKRKFASPGVFPYSCEIHPFMTGRVEVR